MPYDWDNLANGILRCHKLPGVFTEVSEYMHVVSKIKIEVFLLFSAWVGGGGVRLCVSCTSQRYICYSLGKTVTKVLSIGT